MNQTQTQPRIYRWPFLLATITVAGLLFALFGDNAWDALSWLLLAIPIVLLAWLLFFRNRI